MTMDTQTDWRYSDEKMELRQQALLILLNKFGGGLNSSNTSKEPNQAIYECAHDWVSQGNTNCNGIVSYYSAYYSHERQKSLQEDY